TATYNLLSILRARRIHGIYHDQANNTIWRLDDEKVLGYVNTYNDVGYLRTKAVIPLQHAAVIKAKLLHRRLAHCGLPKLKSTAKNSDAGQITEEEFHCEACHLAK